MQSKTNSASSDEGNDTSDDSYCNREIHTGRWVNLEAKRVIEEYFDCEGFELLDDNDDNAYLTNLNHPGDVIRSPTKEEDPPVLNSHLFIKEAYEKSIPKLTISEETRGKFFTLIAGFNMSHSMAFSFVMMRFGGLFFLVPFAICTLCVTLPFNYVHYTLGQYTNTPAAVLYSRMAPMFAGLGVVVTVVQYIASAAIKFDHRFISLVFEFAYSLMTRPRINQNGVSRIKGVLSGYYQACKPDEIYIADHCYPRDWSEYQFAKTDHQYFNIKIEADFQLDPFVAKYAKAQIMPNRILDPFYKQAHYASATLTFSIILFFTTLVGSKSYLERIQYFVFYGMITLCALTILHVLNEFNDQAKILILMIEGDFTQLQSMETWVTAAIHSLIVFSSVDGTYLAIGAANNFSNFIFYDLLVATIGGLFVLILCSMTFGMLSVVGAANWFMKTEKETLSVDDLRVLIRGDVEVYEFLYVFFLQNMTYRLAMLLFVFLFVFWQIGGLMLLAESAIGIVYSLFTTTARLPQFVVRYVSLVFHCFLMFFIHFFFNQSRYIPFVVAPYIVFIQIFAFSILSFQDFFVIFSTVSRHNRPFLYKRRKILKIYVQFALPALLFTMVVFDICHNGFIIATLTMTPVALVAFGQVIRYTFLSKTRNSIRPSHRFRPVFNRDLAEFRRHGKAVERRHRAVHLEEKKNGFRMENVKNWLREKRAARKMLKSRVDSRSLGKNQ